MAAPARPSHLSIFTVLLLLACATSSFAFPIEPLDAGVAHILSRRSASITYDDFGHIQNVTDPTTNAPIAQGDATDGSGTGFDAPAVIWLALSFVTGIPLIIGGLRIWRMTTGIAIGLAATVCLWASFANTTNAQGVSDLLITVICVGSFVLGFAVGVFELGYAAGIAILAFLGGFSIGARLILFRSNLLVHAFFVNWLIITLCGVTCFLLLLARRRIAIAICSSAVGTFMTGLGVDLIINKQAGLSFGLRYLFDRNSSHLKYLLTTGWHPPISSIVILVISLALVPLLAYAQHIVHKSPFRRVRSDSMSSLASAEPRSPSQESHATTREAEEKKAPEGKEEPQTVELNSLHERATPTPNPSVNSLARLLPHKPK